MKLQLALLSTAVFLTACVSNYPVKIVTKGPLICAANEVCPELAMRWIDEKRNGFKVTAEITNPEQYDIKQFNFIIDGQPYTYSTITPTEYSAKESSKTSSNSIMVPVSFLNSFRNAKDIELKLITDKGEISRPIIKANGEKSSAYMTFLKGYTGEVQQ